MGSFSFFPHHMHDKKIFLEALNQKREREREKLIF